MAIPPTPHPRMRRNAPGSFRVSLDFLAAAAAFVSLHVAGLVVIPMLTLLTPVIFLGAEALLFFAVAVVAAATMPAPRFRPLLVCLMHRFCFAFCFHLLV